MENKSNFGHFTYLDSLYLLVECLTRSMTEVFAHRGVHLSHRENTLGAFRAAIELGVDGVELDVRRTADGALVIHHDPTIADQAISRLTTPELPAYVPRLDEAMALLRGICVNVEIKNSPDPEEPTYDDTGTIEREVLEYLRRDELISSVIVSCFDLATCERVRALASDVTVAWLVFEGSLGEALVTAHERGFHAVNPHYSMVTNEDVRFATELGLGVNVWTVNAAKDLETMAEFGVTSVITDEPELAIGLFAER